VRSLAALLLAFALAACGEKPPQLPRLGPADIVLAFGDSLTYGTGAGPEEAYPKILSGLINRPVIAAGVPGETTEGGLERLPGLLDETKPKLLLLCLGGNDMLRQMSHAAIESNLRAMIEIARARGVPVVLIAVPEPVLFGGSAALYDKLAADLKIPLEKNILSTVLFDKELKSDQIHPNARGYQRIAQAIADFLGRAGAI
jgi:lysophospholipase L1-like esterase